MGAKVRNPPPVYTKPLPPPPPPNHAYMRGFGVDFELSESKERAEDWEKIMDCPSEMRGPAIQQYDDKWDSQELKLSKDDPRVMTERGVYVLATIIGVVLFGLFLTTLFGPW